MSKLKRTNTKIIRFEYDDFWVDVVEHEDYYEAWLTKKGYGISDMMFGELKEYGDLNHALSLFEANIEEYIEGYIDEYVDFDDYVGFDD